MEQSGSIYAVTVEAHLPEFESESLFVMNEKKYAQGELDKLDGKPQILQAVTAAVGTPVAKDWRHYMQALDHYLEKMRAHMNEIGEGLVPLKFFVINNGPELDSKIRIRVKVEQGKIHPAKKAPQRPPRVDYGPVHAPERTAVSPLQVVTGGFSRKGITITPHAIEVEFSELEGNDSADLVHQVLYVEATKETHFSYEIESKRLGIREQGEVLFV